MNEMELWRNVQIYARQYNDISTTHRVAVFRTPVNCAFTAEEMEGLKARYKSSRKNRKEARAVVSEITARGYGVRQAAQILGISRQMAYRVMK